MLSVSAAVLVASATLGLSTVPADASRVGSHPFSPSSFSFISASRGWVLGSAQCTGAKRCLSLQTTRDGGQRWSGAALPPGLDAQVRKGNGSGAYSGVSNSMEVHFADASDGWIYNTVVPILWSTHDGGKDWHRITSPDLGTYGSIFDIESIGSATYMLATRRSDEVALWRTSTADDSWRHVPTPTLYLPAGGAEPTGSIVIKGTSAWLVVGNDRGVSASLQRDAAGQWVAWTPPCEAVGDSYFVPVPITPRELAVVCTMGGFASPLSKTAPPGAKLFSNWLYFSSDAGESFRYGPQLTSGWDPELLAAPSARVLLLAQFSDTTANLSRIVRSVDGGRTWKTVYQGPPSTSLSFQSPEHGVALQVNTPGKNELLVTLDGGRDWFHVVFFV